MIGRPNDWAALPEADLPPAELHLDDDATIFYTSGTTGHPKGAVGSHRSMLTNIGSTGWASARGALRRGEAPPASTPKVILTTIPLFHVTACSATLMGAMVAGHAMIFLRRWDVVEAYGIIERERVNMTGGVPTIAWQLLEHPERGRFDLSSLEVISYGGAPAAPELARQLHAVFGVAPGNGWGMTETTATVTSHAGEDYLHRPESAGPPVPVARLRIRDMDGVTELPVGTVGELWATGPQIVRGYWNKPEATAATFVDGWVRTGDLARVDEEGFLFIVDRAKDMIIRGGENIYCVEVENALFDHPAVTDAALIGLPHRTLGEVPAAVVHLAPGAIRQRGRAAGLGGRAVGGLQGAGRRRLLPRHAAAQRQRQDPEGRAEGRCSKGWRREALAAAARRPAAAGGRGLCSNLTLGGRGRPAGLSPGRRLALPAGARGRLRRRPGDHGGRGGRVR